MTAMTDSTSTDSTSTHDDDLATISGLISASRVALLTTQTASGALHSRPLATQKAEFDGDLWFFTQDPSPKVADIHAHPQVNVSYDTGKGYLSLAGTAELVHDRDKVDELWSPSMEAWFPEGKDDPAVALLHVSAESAEFWASHEPGIVKVFKIAKAAVTHTPPDIGENKTVEL